MRTVLDWLGRAKMFERLDAALAQADEPLERKLFEDAMEVWIDLAKTDV
jgi:hypothetical protein